jgi:predicted TIM-barrel fold metal-dependent hydrolase
MGINGWRAADSDLHVMEPPDLWQRYMEPEWAHAAPIGTTEMVRDMRVRVKNHTMLRMGRVRANTGGVSAWSKEQDNVYARAEAAGWSAASQLQAMDDEGLDVAVLFPSRGLFVLGLDSTEQMGSDGLEGDYAAAIARAYNNWMADFVQEDPTRLFGAGLIAPHDPKLARDEVKRCVEELGFKTVMLHPGHVNRRPWHHPEYDQIWAECERQGIPISFHGGGQTYLRPDYSLEVFDKLMHWHVFNQPLGIMAVLTSFTSGGVIHRHPNLRAALLEGNCGWAPWFVQRLDEHWEWVGAMDAPELDRAPSEYFLSNCFLGVEADEDSVQYYVDAFGDDNLVFSTDYPHGDSKYPDALKAFLKLPLSDETKQKILWDNWVRMYGIEVPA